MWKWKFGKETNKQPAPLVIPQGSPFVLSENGKRVFFGKYPQNVYPLNPSFLSLEPNQDGYYTIIGEDTTLVRQKACSAFVAAGGKRIAEGTALFFKREPVEWDVLRFENGEALLISHNILDCKPFSESVAMRAAERKDAHGYEIKFACSDISSVPANSWELSGLREWLNWEFKSSCFSEEDMEHLLPIERGDSLLKGESYSDDVSLLGLEEVADASMGFAPLSQQDEKRSALSTEYARALGLDVRPQDGAGCWWLRSAGFTSYTVARVFYDGYVNEAGKKADSGKFGVRPIIKVRF